MPWPRDVPAGVNDPSCEPWTLAVLRKIALRSIITIVLVGIPLGPILAGFTPIGGDPVLLYQPLKLELARALSAGRLPYWSDLIGLGVPLVAESHVAAFYPPNWLSYRICDVLTAYRLMMVLHMLALAAATFAYARALGLSLAGSAMAAASFALCGFQAVHAIHEPFYHVMPYLPLCLLLADRYVRHRGVVWLAFLALAWGIQITLGHFQIQMWTAGLVLLTGGWRAFTATQVKRQSVFRIIGLLLGLCWGAAVAWVQLRLTWELSTVAGFVRPAESLFAFSFPPRNAPSFFCRRSSSAVRMEATMRTGAAMEQSSAKPRLCGHHSIDPRLRRRDCSEAIRRTVALAADHTLVAGPGHHGGLVGRRLCHHPATTRYRVVSRPFPLHAFDQLGAGVTRRPGLDRSVTPRRFWGGLALAVASGAAVWCWSLYSTRDAEFGAFVGALTLFHALSRGRVDLGNRCRLNHRVAAKLGRRLGSACDHRPGARRAVLHRAGPLGSTGPTARREPGAQAAGCPAGRGSGRRTADKSAGRRRLRDRISPPGYCPSAAQLLARADNDPDRGGR